MLYSDIDVDSQPYTKQRQLNM